MLRVTQSLRTTRAVGKVFFRQNILQGIEEISATDNPFMKSGDRPYPIGEIVRRMVRIKKKCINAVSLGDDHEHALLRGEYKYFTGKAVDVRGASVTDLIAFVQCCSFFKFYDTGSLDRVLEELSLKIATLQPLEVLALMVAVSDLPSKSLGIVDLEKTRQRMDEADAISEKIRDESIGVLRAVTDSKGRPQPRSTEASYTISRKDAGAAFLGGGASAHTDALEITNNKNFTDYRFRRLAVGSHEGSGRVVSTLEGSNRSAMKEANSRVQLAKAEHTYHATLSASFFAELCSQALLFMGNSENESACQYSIEEQLEMLATLPEGADQDLVMSLLDSLAAPLIHYEHFVKSRDCDTQATGSEPDMTTTVEQGNALHELYTSMPWHAVTVAKGLLLVELEDKDALASAEAAMDLGFERFLKGLDANEGRAKKKTMSKSALYRQQKARDEMNERKQRNEGNTLFISRAADILGRIVCATASKPFEVSRVEELSANEFAESASSEADDVLLAYGRECSEAIPASDARKLTRDFYAEHTSGSMEGFAAGHGVGAGMSSQQQRLRKRTHMLTPWEISSAAATLAHLASSTSPIVSSLSTDNTSPLGNGGLSFTFSKDLQQAYCVQLPQCDAMSLALMFSTCRPNVNRYSLETEMANDNDASGQTKMSQKREFLRAQKQFFSFLRLTEERVVFHSSKFTFSEMIDVLGSYMEAYSALGTLHNRLCEEYTLNTGSSDQTRTRKEIAAAKSRLSSNAVVIEALVGDAFAHVDSLSSGELSDPALPLAMLASISINVFNITDDVQKPISRVGSGMTTFLDSCHFKSLSRQELWFRRFPQLQRLIHGLGSILVRDAKNYSIRETIIVLQVAVRMGDKMLDAAVTAALQRLMQLIDLEDYANNDPFSLPTAEMGERFGGLSAIVPLASAPERPKSNVPANQREVQQRPRQSDKQPSSPADMDRELLLSRNGVVSQFDSSPPILERLGFAASLAARNHASELFSVLEELCAYTERRLECERRMRVEETPLLSQTQCTRAQESVYGQDKEVVALAKHSDRSPTQFEGLRPKQIEFIQRLLLPALRKASLTF